MPWPFDVPERILRRSADGGSALGGPIHESHGQLAVVGFDGVVVGSGTGQSCPGGGDAGPADLDGVPVKLPRILTVNEL